MRPGKHLLIARHACPICAYERGRSDMRLALEQRLGRKLEA